MIWNVTETTRYPYLQWDKIKYSSYVQNLLDAILLLVALATIRFLGIPDSTPWMPIEHLAEISAKNTVLKETNSLTSAMFQKNVLPNDDLEKLTRDTQQLTPEREKQ